MAVQASLRFGSLTLCDPGAYGRDGYDDPKYNPRKVDVVEASIPGTTGTVLIQVGVGNTEQTSDSWEINGIHYEATDSALHTWINACRAASVDLRQQIRTLSYGYLNGPSSFSETNCKMSFSQRKTGHGGQPDWWYCEFTVTFTKVGE